MVSRVVWMSAAAVFGTELLQSTTSYTLRQYLDFVYYFTVSMHACTAMYQKVYSCLIRRMCLRKVCSRISSKIIIKKICTQWFGTLITYFMLKARNEDKKFKPDLSHFAVPEQIPPSPTYSAGIHICTAVCER